MSLLDAPKEFLWGVLLKKVTARIIQAAVAYALAHGAAGLGIELNPELLTAGALAGLETLRNYLKVKRGWDLLP